MNHLNYQSDSETPTAKPDSDEQASKAAASNHAPSVGPRVLIRVPELGHISTVPKAADTSRSAAKHANATTDSKPMDRSTGLPVADRRWWFAAATLLAVALLVVTVRSLRDDPSSEIVETEQTPDATTWTMTDHAQATEAVKPSDPGSSEPSDAQTGAVSPAPSISPPALPDAFDAAPFPVGPDLPEMEMRDEDIRAAEGSADVYEARLRARQPAAHVGRSPSPPTMPQYPPALPRRGEENSAYVPDGRAVTAPYNAPPVAPRPSGARLEGTIAPPPVGPNGYGPRPADRNHVRY